MVGRVHVLLVLQDLASLVCSSVLVLQLCATPAHCMNALHTTLICTTARMDRLQTLHYCIVLPQDVFGWGTPEIRQWADAMAGAGYVAIIPDFFRGDPVSPDAAMPSEVFKW